MSTSHTPNYNLCQWEASDQVLRTDFNEDNAKVDDALGELAAKVDVLWRLAPDIGYNLGQFGLISLNKHGIHPGYRTMIWHNFSYTDMFTFTGGAVVENGRLVLKGKGTTGTMISANHSLRRDGWTRAWLWVHVSGGNIEAKLNGTPMKLSWLDYDHIASDWRTTREFTWTGTGGTSACITLDMTCTDPTQMVVYDYCLMVA